ncbi:V-type ATP synthase subunit A, partial [Cyanobium sp. N5-Cardenillas]|nr:V-type ATP synthase subunit A [Cyanobium sp. N5-Cardenillas]
VAEMNGLLKEGDRVGQMIQVTGEEGVSLADFIVFQKALFLDMVYLQQDAFDAVDSTTPLERQKTSFDLVFDLLRRDPTFTDKKAARDYYTQLTGLYRNLNYAASGSPTYRSFLQQIQALSGTPTPSPAATP